MPGIIGVRRRRLRAIRRQRSLQRQHQCLEIGCKSRIRRPARRRQIRFQKHSGLRDRRFERLRIGKRLRLRQRVPQMCDRLHDGRGNVSTPLLRCAIQARFASSRAGFCCRGTNFRSASVMTAVSADDSVGCDDTVSSASTGLLRSMRTCSRSPSCGPVTSPDGKTEPDIAGPRCRATAPRCPARRTATAWRMAPTRHSASRLGLGLLPDPRRLTRSTRILGGDFSLFRCELLQQFSGRQGRSLSA